MEDCWIFSDFNLVTAKGWGGKLAGHCFLWGLNWTVVHFYCFFFCSARGGPKERERVQSQRKQSLTGVRIKFIWLGTFMVAKFLVQPAKAWQSVVVVDWLVLLNTIQHLFSSKGRADDGIPYLTIASDWLMNLYRIRNSNALSFGGW